MTIEWAATIIASLALVFVAGMFVERLVPDPDKRSHGQTASTTRLVRVVHADGNNCPDYWVQLGNDYPITWCPFCGELTVTIEEETSA